MLFSSITFIYYFLPITLLVYFLLPKVLKNVWLLIASIIFYSWGEPVYVFLMLFSSIFNYSMARDMDRERRKGINPKMTFMFTVVVNLFILGFFKYYGFLMDTINGILGTSIHYTALALPIGISFYTFQALSYIIDVYWGNVRVQTSPIKFCLYLALFPQLIAGPIVKYKDIDEQLDNRQLNVEKFGHGSIRFILGLSKKVILANNLGLIYDLINQLPDNKISILTYWIGIFAYTLQIYFDFSGYSDMAIGIGKMLGFEFMENFNYPYLSKSITEFWRRWHISLSTWFKEYLYIPLGGNKVAPIRHILNILVVWSLTGLWHGASWNFVAWGLYYGILLILEKYVYGRLIDRAPNFVRHIYTLLIVMIGWVLFSSENLSTALSYIGIMFGVGKYPLMNFTTMYFLKTNLLLLIIGGFVATKKPIEYFNILCERKRGLGIFLLLLFFVISTAYLVFSTYNPFLYFRF